MEKYVSVIEILAHGIDPGTGEVLPDHSPYNNPEVIRALFFALSSMKKPKKPGQRAKQTVEEKQSDNLAKGKPKNAGQPWTDEQRRLLTKHFSAGDAIDRLAELHERTEVAITSELKKLKLID